MSFVLGGSASGTILLSLKKSELLLPLFSNVGPGTETLHDVRKNFNNGRVYIALLILPGNIRLLAVN